jgi:hypothetical protein
MSVLTMRIIGVAEEQSNLLIGNRDWLTFECLFYPIIMALVSMSQFGGQ